MFMATLNFDPKKITEQILKQGLEEMKRQFTNDINRLARPYGERPKITFKPKGPESFRVHVEVKSDELRSKIDSYLKSKAR
jgi:hypothetical protein